MVRMLRQGLIAGGGLDGQQIDHHMSARKTAQEQDFEAIVRMLDEGVIVIRPDGYLKFINPAAMRIYDLESERAAADFVMQAATSPCYDADGTRLPPSCTRLRSRSAGGFPSRVRSTEWISRTASGDGCSSAAAC
jgi:PAS domain-containing protein